MNKQLSHHRILVAMDFSPCSEAALRQAVWLARRTGAQIVLANAIPDQSKSAYWGPHERKTNQQVLCQTSETAMRRMIVDMNAMDLDVKF